MTDLALQKLDRLTEAVAMLARTQGARLTRQEVQDRLRISSPTLRQRIRDGQFPPPNSDGKWMLADIIHWEARH